MSDDEFRVLEQRVPDPDRANDTYVTVAAAFAGVFSVAFAVALRLGAPLAVYAVCLAVACISLALAVRRYFYDRFPEVVAAEPRDEGAAEPRDEGAAADNERDPTVVRALPRRGFLTRVLLGAFGALGVSLLALVPSLGPRVGDTLRRTPWGRGVRAVLGDGEPVRPEDIPVGGIASVWPEDAIGFERAAVVLIRLADPPLDPTNMAWVVDESLVGYSKICTHAGCPVALYREQDESLFCPCHQSTFDVKRACEPVFGPAARALPQLPLGVDDEGFLIAMDDFRDVAGPSHG